MISLGARLQADRGFRRGSCARLRRPRAPGRERETPVSAGPRPAEWLRRPDRRRSGGRRARPPPAALDGRRRRGLSPAPPTGSTRPRSASTSRDRGPMRIRPSDHAPADRGAAARGHLRFPLEVRPDRPPGRPASALLQEGRHDAEDNGPQGENSDPLMTLTDQPNATSDQHGSEKKPENLPRYGRNPLSPVVLPVVSGVALGQIRDAVSKARKNVLVLLEILRWRQRTRRDFLTDQAAASTGTARQTRSPRVLLQLCFLELRAAFQHASPKVVPNASPRLVQSLGGVPGRGDARLCCAHEQGDTAHD